MLRTLFIMDSIESIDIYHDSTFAMLLEAQNRKYDLSIADTHHLHAVGDTGIVESRRVSVKKLKDKHFEYLGVEVANLSSFDVVLMRKDPPFDMNYIFSTYLLDRAVASGCFVTNSPTSLRNQNEKMSILQFPNLIPETLVTSSKEQILSFASNQKQKIILKPLDGMGGKGIFLTSANDPNLSVIWENLTDHGSKMIMAQTYVPEIKETGDRRIIVIDGKAVGALARVPKGTDHRGNMAAGAKAEFSELNKRDLEITEILKPVFDRDGILLAGIDVIGDYLTEINITSPTGFQEIERTSKINCASIYLDSIEKKIKSNA